ncbi:uncharacterized protein PHACADRAFT_194911 [Phanerochaete carnosa HHB-10118-sp]|uniref:NmrA-like domain-containing protein n=1 Tax=Phanerochaete carnosa (strain HHB-10118-sp) TaxID=650164 RepID=K5V452_PHACS|nr:uncharacterized protein PHACADRAFT_194911 [Phanerochaete carnosa HHB-10118-sp]EKM57356.1 hypothetical protein PHACADRAFT_194911 [Phanerochaete carnosa HHB-10118-sp]
MTPRKILVVGATGKQGSAFTRAAITANGSVESDHSFHLIALTRNASSPAARELTALGDSTTVVSADVNDANSVRKVFEDEKVKPEGGIWGVFMVLAFPGLGADASGEEAQGKMIADLAREYNVHHLIYSSAERAHESRDEHATLSYLAKVNIEKHIKSKQGLSWTILRPVFFMENFDGLIGRVTFSVLQVGLKKDTRLQLIAADDIGNVAFAVMRSPDAYAGQCIVVVGDALSTQEIAASYTRGAGRAIPTIPNMLASTLKATNKHTRGVVEAVENAHADRIEYGVKYEDLIAKCREIYPGMHSFESWAKVHNPKAERKEGWNGVSLKGLLSGSL